MKRKNGEDEVVHDDSSNATSLLSKASARQNASLKQSRLAPSLPMHMKTRGSQRATSVFSGSGNSSRRSSASRSLNGVVSGDETEQPTKRPRLSRESSSKEASQSSLGSNERAPRPPKLGTFSTTGSVSSPKQRHSDAEDEDEYQQAINSIEPATESQDYSAQVQGTELMPRKRLGRPPKKTGSITEISNNAAPVAKRPPGRPPKPGRPALSRQASEKVSQRIPGRRRKPNPNAVLEANIARMAEIRRAYKVLAKMVKPAVGDIADRTITELENDPEAHTHVSEHSEIQNELDARLNQRIASIEREYQLFVQHEKKKLDIEMEAISISFQRKLRDTKEEYVNLSKRKVIDNIRALQVLEDGDATDEEFQSTIDPPTGRSLLRDTSRSVFYVETEQEWQELEARARAGKALDTYSPDLVREMGRMHLGSHRVEQPTRIEVDNMQKLKRATSFVDALSAVDPNDTVGIDVLAEISTRMLENGDLSGRRPTASVISSSRSQVTPESAGPAASPTDPPALDRDNRKLGLPANTQAVRPFEGSLEGGLESHRASKTSEHKTSEPSEHEAHLVQNPDPRSPLLSASNIASWNGVRQGDSILAADEESKLSANNDTTTPGTTHKALLPSSFKNPGQPDHLILSPPDARPTVNQAPSGKTVLPKEIPSASATAGKNPSFPANNNTTKATYVSPYSRVNEQSVTQNAHTPHILPVPQGSTRDSSAFRNPLTQTSPSQVQTAQQLPPAQPAPAARRRELRPAPTTAIPNSAAYGRYPQDPFFAPQTPYGPQDVEHIPSGRVTDNPYGYNPPFDPIASSGYHSQSPYTHPAPQQMQYQPYLMYNPQIMALSPLPQPGQGALALQPAYAGQPRLAPNYINPPPPIVVPQRPLTFQYYQPPNNPPGSSPTEQPRR